MKKTVKLMAACAFFCGCAAADKAVNKAAPPAKAAPAPPAPPVASAVPSQPAAAEFRYDLTAPNPDWQILRDVELPSGLGRAPFALVNQETRALIIIRVFPDSLVDPVALFNSAMEADRSAGGEIYGVGGNGDQPPSFQEYRVVIRAPNGRSAKGWAVFLRRGAVPETLVIFGMWPADADERMSDDMLALIKSVRPKIR